MIEQSTTACVTGQDQCRQFLSTLAPKDGSREIWIKQGHKCVYRATWDEEGNLSGILTALKDKDDSASRIDKGRIIFNLLKVLSDRCQTLEGGAFYIPTQPQNLPRADCVTCTDDIGVEVDDLGYEAQLELFESFQAVSSLSLSSLLSSGGKSFHAHIKVDFHAPLPEMTYLRRLAQLAFTSDPKMVDLHQPMRLPGFYRKEKQSMQTLISFSDAKYSLEAIKAGFQKWFIFKGWAFPDEISDTWWSEVFRPNLNGLNKATREAKIRFTEKMLAEGQDAYVSRRIAETEQRQQAIAKMPAVTGTQISDLVQQCCDRANIGDFSGVDWQGSPSHLRGQCPFHSGESGNSAWLSDQGGAMRFHCSSCTEDAPRNSFEYWVARSGLASIDGRHGLKGRAYVEAAKGFLDQYGVSLPKESKAAPLPLGNGNGNGNGHKLVDAEGFELLEPIAEDKTKTLESEFEQVKNKLKVATDKVEKLTIEWEEADPENKKEIKERLANAKAALKALTSARYASQLEIKRATAKVKGEAETGFAKDFLVIQHKLANRLSYNSLSKQIYFDEEEIRLNSTSCFLVDITGHINWNKSDAQLESILLDFAKKNSFCPIKRYLEAIETPISHVFLEDAARYIFGVTSEIQVLAFKAQMMGSVKRVFEPGCIHRLMPIIYSSKQLKGKSTFIENLYGKQFYSDGRLDMGDKDGQMMVHSSWAHEVAECDGLFKTRESSDLKAFVSCRADTYRAPYERNIGTHPRRSVLWGTTNKRVFLTDSTGNTRYPVLAMPDDHDLPNEWVKENRDNLWAAALDGYRNGIPNQLPKEMADRAEEEALDFCEEDALIGPIRDYLLSQSKVTVLQVAEFLGYEADNFSMPEQRRIGGILSTLGWEKKRFNVGTSKATFWVKVGQ